jgi:polar amino acid transport system substrate-binding protein
MAATRSWICLLASIVAAMALTTPASADKLDDVKARGRLLVGVTESSPPFSYLVPGKGIVGYDVDLAERVAESLGVKTEKIAIINADRIPALQSDRVDLVAVGMTRSKGRAKDIDFSFAYLDSPHMVLVRKDSGIAHIAQLAGRKLALVKSASVDAELKAAVPTMQIVFFDDYNGAFAALAAGSVDGFLADKMLLLWFAQKSAHPEDFTLMGDYQLPRTAGFALKKNEPRFLDFVNRTLLKLEASGEAAKVYDTWFAPVPRTFRIQPD